jgi:hypothetical protein
MRVSTFRRLSLFLPALILILLWIHSYSARDSVYFAMPSWGGVLNSSAGAITHGGAVWTSRQDWSFHPESIPVPDMDWLDPHFRFHVTSGGSSWHFSIPYWLAILIAGTPPVIYLLVRHRRSPLPDQGRCGAPPTSSTIYDDGQLEHFHCAPRSPSGGRFLVQAARQN